MTRTLRLGACGALLLCTTLVPHSRAFAMEPDKILIALQVQVQELQDALARMQQVSDERWALTKQSMDQNADALSRIAQTLNSMQQTLNNNSDSQQMQQLSTQIQSTHDSVDELRARLGRMEKMISDLQGQLQNMPQPQAQPAITQPGNGGNADNQPPANQPAAQPAAPPVKELYQGAYRDYSGGHDDLAVQEFQQVIQAYPGDDLSGNAYYYLGEIAYRHGQYKEAVKAYSAVLENYPGNKKMATAQLRKGDCLIQLGQRTAGIKELRGLIQRYPQSPEALQARTTLNGMGVNPSPRQ